jgi:DNA-directed RNA polymerase specialized sigma24 family protein
MRLVFLPDELSPLTKPSRRPGCVGDSMSEVDSIEALFREEFARLVRSFSVAFGVEQATDAVQEAFIAADSRWERISGYDDVAGWVRRVALNRLLNERRRQRRRSEIVDAVRPLSAVEVTDELLDLDVLSREVGCVADGWVASEGGVAAVMVVAV